MRFGIAGLRNVKDLKASVAAVVEEGYAACEVQFVKEFTLKEEGCRTLGELARDAGIALSVHAPYFAQLTTAEPERVKLHSGALHHSCKLAAMMGASIVVCHPGSDHDEEPEVLHERVNTALNGLAARIGDTGVKLGLETCGRKSQFGTVGDIAMLVANHPFTAPVIDFAHVHALSGGTMTTPEAFRALFEFVTKEFSSDHLWPLHCHFTDNRFGPAGEISHVPYGEGGVRMTNLVEGAQGFDFDLTVISEQKEPASHAKILAELRRLNAPLLAPGDKAKRGLRLLASKLDPAAPGAPEETRGLWFPHEIPLERRGEAHYFKHGGREVRITNLSKVFFPDDGYTKGDLITYYYNVAPLMLPFLRDRPITMQRVPDGIYGDAFYEKQAPKGAPEWVRTVPVPKGGGTKSVDFIIVDDLTTLVWLAQIASVECHAWTSKWPDIDQPDYAVMDLDPHEPISFGDVRDVCKLVNVVLDRLGVKGFPKTSGGAGLQVFIPLTGGHTYSDVREFCAGVGRLIQQAYPEKVSMEPSKPKRAGKVYVDVDQNAKGQTLVAPYSVRPYPGAPVSMPLRWEELDDDFMPEQFTIATAFERIEEAGDLFRPALSLRQDLHPALEQLR
jgi:bifunctional non-homologous end joining protein LigD